MDRASGMLGVMQLARKGYMHVYEREHKCVHLGGVGESLEDSLGRGIAY